MGSIWLSYPYLAPKFCCCRHLITLQQRTLHYFSLGAGLHPWKFSRFDWIKPWATISDHTAVPALVVLETSDPPSKTNVGWVHTHLHSDIKSLLLGHFRNCLLYWHDSQRTAGVSVLIWRRPTPIYLLGCSAEAQENRFLLNTNILPSL